MPKLIKPRKHAYQRHACRQCTAVFVEASHLGTHVRTSHSTTRTRSPPRTLLSNSPTDRGHVRTVHEKRRDHTCPHCVAAFGQASNLTAHVRTVHLAPHCAAIALTQLVAGRGGEDEEQAVENEGGDSEPEWAGEGLVGRKVRIAYPDEDGEGSTYWPVTVKAFSVNTKEHLVVGEDFESREDLHDCHWRFT